MQIHYEQALKSYLDERTRRKLWELQAQRHSESEGWRTEWKQLHKTKPFMIGRLILSQMLLTWQRNAQRAHTSHYVTSFLWILVQRSWSNPSVDSPLGSHDF